MKSHLSKRQAALTVSLSIIIMTVVAGMAMGMVFTPLFSLSETDFGLALNKNPMLLVWGTIGWAIILICDLLASWGIFHFYKEVNHKKAVSTAVLRVIYSVILGYAIVKLITACMLLNSGSSSIGSIRALLFEFQSIWQFGLIIFGLHLLYLAPLVCKRKNIRQLISALIFLAGIGYLASNTADLFISEYESIRMRVEAVFILPMIFGEFGLAIWLLVKGGRVSSSKGTQYVSESY